MKHLFTITLLLNILLLHAQDSQFITVAELPPGYTSHIDKKLNGLDNRLSRQSEKYLKSLARQEEKIFKSLAALDSSALEDVKEKYSQLSQQFNNAGSRMDRLLSGRYLPGVDSLATSLGFLKDAGNIVSKTRGIQQKPGSSLQNLQQLQSKLNEAEAIQQFVQQRQQQLKQLLSNYSNLPKDISRHFGKYQREAFYYSQQLTNLKESLDQPDKLIAKTLAVLKNIPAFSSFWEKHSMISAMFPTPDNYGTPQVLAGLQTRANVQQLLQQQIGIPATSGANANPAQYLQQQMQQSQGELSKLKDKMSQLGINSGGSSDMTMPEFKPNSQKTKSFLQRLDFTSNFQTQKSNQYYPVRTDISINVGYKLSDQAVAGVGLAGRLGWGDSWQKIRLSSQGGGFRSYFDWKAPDLLKTNSRLISSLWFTVGMELNYHRPIEDLAVFKNYNNWNKSALAGLTKKFGMNSPLKKGRLVQGNMQVLYDFLHQTQVPRTPALVWRVGYGL
ncbi:MAG: hypothetical protein KF862_11575 [Chitinophagaceae bacterium]|nr:hypothetical protein [Chitinophagaceae bacterium]